MQEYHIAGYFRKCKFSYKQLKCLLQKFSYAHCHAPFHYTYVTYRWYGVIFCFRWRQCTMVREYHIYSADIWVSVVEK